MTESEKKQWQKYINESISHGIKLVEYGNYFYDKIRKKVDKAKQDCQKYLSEYRLCATKIRCSELKRKIKKRLLKLKDEISVFILQELPKIAENENIWINENVYPLFGIKAIYDTKLIEKLLIIPIATAGAAIGFSEIVFDKLISIYNSEIIQAYVTGIPFKELEDDYKVRFNSFTRGLQADSETLGESLGEQYTRIIYTKNKDKIKRYMWSAVLDSNTCLACASLDGQIYENISNVPVYPLHDRCRCKLLLVPDFVNNDGAKFTYTQWFEQQSDMTKLNILGRTRYQLYKEGMRIKQFVNNGNITPLSDLKSKMK